MDLEAHKKQILEQIQARIQKPLSSPAHEELKAFYEARGLRGWPWIPTLTQMNAETELENQHDELLSQIRHQQEIQRTGTPAEQSVAKREEETLQKSLNLIRERL
jgi:hypothetical protein